MPKKKRKFESTPTLPDAAALEAFTSGVERRIGLVPEPVISEATAVVEPAAVAPATSLARDAKPTNGINLRLNDYELDLVRTLAKREDRSMQKTIKRILIPALEKALAQ